MLGGNRSNYCSQVHAATPAEFAVRKMGLSPEPSQRSCYIKAVDLKALCNILTVKSAVLL